MISQYSYTSVDSPELRQGGWQIKDTAGLDEAEVERERTFIAALGTISPLEDCPLIPTEEDRENFATRLMLSGAGHRKRLSQERPVGDDAAGRRGNSYIHGLIAPMGELAEDITLPIRAFRAPWWNTPFGPDEVAASSLSEPAMSPSFLPDDWTDLAPYPSTEQARSQLAFLASLLEAIDATVSARRKGEERTLIVIRLEDMAAAAVWMEAIEALAILPDAWDIHFSTYERRLLIQDCQTMLEAGLDLVFVPAADQLQRGGPVEIFTPGEQREAPESGRWGGLLMRASRVAGSDSAWSDLIMSIEGLIDPSPSLVPSDHLGWGLACAMINRVGEAERKELEDLLIWQAPGQFPSDCPAAHTLGEIVSRRFNRSEDIFALYPLVVGASPSASVERNACERLLDRALESPELMFQALPFRKIPPLVHAENANYPLAKVQIRLPDKDRLRYDLATLLLASRLGFPVTEDVAELIGLVSAWMVTVDPRPGHDIVSIIDELPESYRQLLAQSVDGHLARASQPSPVLSPAISGLLASRETPRLEGDLVLALTSLTWRESVRDRRLAADLAAKEEVAWGTVPHMLAQPPTAAEIPDETIEQILRRAPLFALPEILASPRARNLLVKRQLMAGYDRDIARCLLDSMKGAPPTVGGYVASEFPHASWSTEKLLGYAFNVLDLERSDRALHIDYVASAVSAVLLAEARQPGYLLHPAHAHPRAQLAGCLGANAGERLDDALSRTLDRQHVTVLLTLAALTDLGPTREQSGAHISPEIVELHRTFHPIISSSERLGEVMAVIAERSGDPKHWAKDVRGETTTYALRCGLFADAKSADKSRWGKEVAALVSQGDGLKGQIGGFLSKLSRGPEEPTRRPARREARPEPHPEARDTRLDREDRREHDHRRERPHDRGQEPLHHPRQEPRHEPPHDPRQGPRPGHPSDDPLRPYPDDPPSFPPRRKGGF
ncbi:MAG: hypothetical protein Q4P33_06355 [Flaviflexus sp.]|nr:hypothetical protein [Flaviflexus sp.]